MAFTRFHDDPCRIQKYLEETTYIGNYEINVPGTGDKPEFMNDVHLRPQNLSKNKTELESDLMGITRRLNTDTIEENSYQNHNNKNNLYNQNVYPTNKREITEQPRATNPAWTVREIDSINTPNNFKYLLMDPQEHVAIPFNNNIPSRMLEKDYYVINNKYKK